MKHLLSLLALATVLGFAIPTTASADHQCGRRIVSYLPCGRPVYAVYQICGYDRCGNPVGHWVTQRPSCSCSVCNPRPSCDHGHGHGHGHSSRSHYSSPRRSYGSSSGWGVSFFLGR
jgi:hypothetical protein